MPWYVEVLEEEGVGDWEVLDWAKLLKTFNAIANELNYFLVMGLLATNL